MRVKGIAFTVLPVVNLKAARDFYERVLGLVPTSVYEKDGMGMIEYEIDGSTLAIGAGAPLLKPSKDGGAVALEVEDFGAAIKRLREHGVPLVMPAYETPVCHMAMVADPDGNFIMLHHRKDG